MWLDRWGVLLIVSSFVGLGGLQHLGRLRAEEAVAVSAGSWDLSSPLAAAPCWERQRVQLGCAELGRAALRLLHIPY